MATLTNEKVAAVLGRPLKDTETIRLGVLAEVAKLRLEAAISSKFGDNIPADLEYAWAKLTLAYMASGDVSQAAVSSKRVEDFSVAYKDGFDPISDTMKQLAGIIATHNVRKPVVRHGETLPVNKGGYGVDDGF